MALTTILALAAGVYVLYLYVTSRKRRAGTLPPGPKGLPIVGNVADMPPTDAWLTFAEWGRKWGGIVSVTVMGQPIIIVNSPTIMEEIEKKGSIFSDRPVLEMGGELVGHNKALVLTRYGPRFRNYRKLFSRYFGSANIKNLHSLLEDETRRFLRREAEKQENLWPNLRKLAGGIVLRATYGYDVGDGEDAIVNVVELSNEHLSDAIAPGAFLVDTFPFLSKLPEWLPGMGFMETARVWAKDTVDAVELPFNYTKKQMAAGTAIPSFISTGLEDEAAQSEEYIRDLKYTASSMYGGGADTNVSVGYGFYLGMVLFPEVQKKAQAEIESVIGNGRLPNMSDRQQLPYINALMTEMLRWHSVAPTGAAHTSSEDGELGGYFIPKGSLIVSNLWNMLNDPETYPDPFTLNPERFIPAPGREIQRDPRKHCFGFGRRICPGMYIGEESFWLLIAMTLAVFDIEKAVVDGVPITPVHENTSAIISHQKPFKCHVKPRSEKALALIMASQT